MVIQGAPNDTARIASTTVATIQDDLVSMDCTIAFREGWRGCVIDIAIVDVAYSQCEADAL